MLIIPPACQECGVSKYPTELRCDKCGIIHPIDSFNGAVLKFSNHNDCYCCEDRDCTDCDIDPDVLEFHFCDIRCLSEFIIDPISSERLSDFDLSAMALFLDADGAKNLFYILGSSNWYDKV